MAQKRSNGEGTLRKRPTGLWECTMMIGFQENGKRKYKSFYGKTQKEAKEKAKQFLADQMAGRIPAEELSFEAWARRWYENYQDQVSPTTYESYGYTLRILIDAFGKRKLDSIKAMDVEEFLRSQLERGKSKSSLAKFRGMLYQIMHKAEANDLIRKNPVRFADQMRNAGTEKRKEAFTLEEVQRLMQKLPQNRIGNSIRLMLATGIRGQELLALKPEDIAQDGSSIQISKAVKLVKGTVAIGAPKSARSFRTVPVPTAVRPYALALRATEAPYIWTGKDGTRPCNPSYFRDQFRQALETVGGVRLLTPHSCRHTYVSQLQAQGVPLETIQSLVGHADLDMTEHYLHVQENVRQEAAEKLAALFKTRVTA